MNTPGNPGCWRLEPASSDTIGELMSWFDDADAVKTWGGPRFRYPYTREIFEEDCHWPAMASYALIDPAGALAAFGQFYDRNGRINFARLVVRPGHRGRGVGKRLLGLLMRQAAEELPLDEFSLFVYRDNVAALGCYRSMGFTIQDYPADQFLADECYFLTRPTIAVETQRP